MRRWWLLLGLAGLLGGCYGKKLVRQPLTVDATHQEVTRLRARVDSLSAQVDSLDRVVRDHDAAFRSLKAAFVTQLEQLATEVRSLNSQLQDMMGVVSLSGATPTPSPPGPPQSGVGAEEPPASQEPAPVGEPLEARRLYEKAKANLDQGNYQLALMGFREFLDRFPESTLADNAQYWIGEVYYAQGRYDRAIEEFLKVTTDYPGADKIPAAYLKVAFAFRSKGDRPTARRYLRYLVEHFPESREAEMAASALEELR
jgi:tol-pal system protein YbgF